MPHALRHLVLDARYVGPEASGIARYTWQLGRLLPTLDPSLRVTLVCDPRCPDANLSDALSACRDRIRYVTFDAPPNSLRTRWWLPRALDLRDVDVFFSPFNILPARLPVRSVFTLHDLMWLLDPWLCTDVVWRRWVTGSFYGTFIPASARDATRILTVSDHSARDIEARFPTRAGRIHVAPNGVDPWFQRVPEAEAWTRLEGILPAGTAFVLVVGQGAPYKNHGRAAEAFVRAFGEDPRMHLVLVRRIDRGAPPALRALFEDPRLAGRIHVLPQVGQEVLRALYTCARIFFFPSLYEGFGLPALEAMACGAPVLTAAGGATAEVCGPAALTVDPRDVAAMADALRRLDGEAGLRQRLSTAGPVRAADVTWDRCAQTVLDVLRLAAEDPWP